MEVQLQGVEHMVAAVLSCKMALVGSGWDNLCHHCTNGLRKCYSCLVSTSFLVRKVVSGQEYRTCNICTWKSVSVQSYLLYRACVSYNKVDMY